MSRKHRAAFARLALAAYLVPYSVTMVAAGVHAVSHLADILNAERARIVAMGFSHQGLSARPDRVIEIAVPEADGGFVHAHGGSEHSHGSFGGTLLDSASEHDAGEDGLSAPPSLVVHVPARAIAAAWQAGDADGPPPTELANFGPFAEPPTPPPPRA